MSYLRIENNQAIGLEKLEVEPYGIFYNLVIHLLAGQYKHCVNYFAYPIPNGLQFIMAIADDKQHDIIVLSHQLNSSENQVLESLTEKCYALQFFEREIYENFGIEFMNHPWLKPVRFAHNRADKNKKIANYPFYKIEGEELHEIAVGPIHAGIIEPGHFRFICNGENVLHLEIQLGWQHRGVEQLFLDKKQGLQKNILAENISGDTVIGHTTTFVQTMEALTNKKLPEQLHIERALALELERIAIHTADIGGLCTDVGYLLGANIFNVLRTPIINFMQSWCGNRLGKSLIRIGGTHFPFTEELKMELQQVLHAYEVKFEEMAYLLYRLPSVQNRFDFVGKVSKKQALLLGTVGLSARMSSVNKDIRKSHPNKAYQRFEYNPITVEECDVFGRFLLKKMEIRWSLNWLKNVLTNYTFDVKQTIKPAYNYNLKPNSFSISLTEAWRGEVCHCAITNKEGELQHYKVKDPSIHNWKALELSLRNTEISDFPINNKSYNLSYCGSDL